MATKFSQHVIMLIKNLWLLCPHGDRKTFGHHLHVEIVATERLGGWGGRKRKVFGCHTPMVIENLSVTTIVFRSPPPTRPIFSFLHSPPPPLDGNWNLFNHHVVWSLNEKLGVLMGTHWELFGNMLGTMKKWNKIIFIGSKLWHNFVTHIFSGG
jgi:hypothetical protein